MEQINKTAIQEIAGKNDTAEAFFEYLRKRERNARGGENSIQSIKQQMEENGFRPAPQELLSTLRELDRAGIIEMHGDRFKWRVGIKDVARAVASDRRPKLPARPLGGVKTLVVCLDSHRRFKAEFPANLSRSEVRFLCEILLQNVE